MASYDLSGPADRDLTEIYFYSFRPVREVQADTYLLALHDAFAQLADMPTMGRSIDRLRVGYFRYEHASHVVFYIKTEDGIRIVRVLHARMDPFRHL